MVGNSTSVNQGKKMDILEVVEIHENWGDLATTLLNDQTALCPRSSTFSEPVKIKLQFVSNPVENIQPQDLRFIYIDHFCLFLSITILKMLSLIFLLTLEIKTKYYNEWNGIFSHS